jgi:protein-S-isoprenylcysteine O-methyltransferase Ste14
MTVQALGADADSNAANQTGQLTPEQQRRVTAAVNAEAAPGLVGGACLAFLFVVIMLAGSRSYSSNMGMRDYLLFGGLTFLSLLVMAAFFLRRSRALQEARVGQLQRASGHVVWQGGAYRAEVPGHNLNLSAFNLGAGTYEFSFLPRSGRVIAAELVALDSPAQAQDELRHALAMSNHFNLDDLPAYRRGSLGNSGRYLRRTWTSTAWIMFFAVLCLVMFAYFVGADVAKDLAPFTFLIGMFLAVWALFSVLGNLIPTLDVLGGHVNSAEGLVQKIIRRTYGRGASTYYYYRLGIQTWTVTPEAYRALIEGPNYRVYFLPRSKLIVGIEPKNDV